MVLWSVTAITPSPRSIASSSRSSTGVAQSPGVVRCACAGRRARVALRRRRLRSHPARAGGRRATSSPYSASSCAATTGNACAAAISRPARARRPTQLCILEQSQRDGAGELGRASGEGQAALARRDQRGGRRVVGRGDRDARCERPRARAAASRRGRPRGRGTAQQQLACERGGGARDPRTRERTRAGARRDQHDLGAQGSQRARDRPHGAAVAGRRLDDRTERDERLRSLVCELDPGRDQVPVALARVGSERLEHCRRARDEGIGEPEPAIAAAGGAERHGQRGVEGGDAERAPLTGAAVRRDRETRLVHVHDVETRRASPAGPRRPQQQPGRRSPRVRAAAAPARARSSAACRACPRARPGRLRRAPRAAAGPRAGSRDRPTGPQRRPRAPALQATP